MALDKMFTKSFNAIRELGGKKKSARVQNLCKKKTFRKQIYDNIPL